MGALSQTKLAPAPVSGVATAAKEGPEYEKSDIKGQRQQVSVDMGKKEPQTDDLMQAGVKKIEAAAAVWSKWHLVAAYGKSVFVSSVQTMKATLLIWSTRKAYGSSTS